MQSLFQTFAVPDWVWTFAAGSHSGSGITGLEFVAATDVATGNPAPCQLKVQFSGGKGGGTVYLRPGDTFHFDPIAEPPNGAAITCDTVGVKVELRMGFGWSLRAPNGTLSLQQPLEVEGPLPFYSSMASLLAYGNPLIPSMLKDESEQGNGPWDVLPLRSFTRSGLWTEQVDNFEGFVQNFGPGVAVSRDVNAFGCARVTFDTGTPNVLFTDARNVPVPILRVSTHTWIYSGIAANIDTYYVPTVGLGQLVMTQDAGSGAVDGHISLSPRTVPPLS